MTKKACASSMANRCTAECGPANAGVRCSGTRSQLAHAATTVPSHPNNRAGEKNSAGPITYRRAAPMANNVGASSRQARIPGDVRKPSQSTRCSAALRAPCHHHLPRSPWWRTGGCPTERPVPGAGSCVMSSVMYRPPRPHRKDVDFHICSLRVMCNSVEAGHPGVVRTSPWGCCVQLRKGRPV